MLASVCIMGFIFSFSQYVPSPKYSQYSHLFFRSATAGVPYFFSSPSDASDVNTEAYPSPETLFVDHLLKKIEEINVFIQLSDQNVQLKRLIYRS